MSCIPMESDGDHFCVICRERFKSYWDEEHEEWMWRDAIKLDGKYFHHSCHLEASAAPSPNPSAPSPPPPTTSPPVSLATLGKRKYGELNDVKIQ